MNLRAAILALAVGACGAAEQVNEVYDRRAPSEPPAELPDQSLVAAFNTCPQILSYQASPLSAPVGSSVELSVSAVDLDGDAISYEWIVSEPNLSEPNEPKTSYRCSREGYRVATVRLSDARCTRSLSVLFLCTEEGP